jgi:tyrosyl-tRNA synthetase
MKTEKQAKKEIIKDILERGVEEIITKKEFEAALNVEKSLRIYYGVDPSGAQIHLGHAVNLWKLSLLQELGHKIIFLIGDFTGMIGDPTDREAVRQPLTREEVLKNAETYKTQVARFLNFSGKNAAEIRFNSEWNDKLNFKDIIELSSRFTVQQLLERDMFKKRLAAQKPISMHEFLYPVIQGYDAFMLDADAQMGGTDQLFNMLQGRQLIRALKNKVQSVITVKLLVGTDGRKMSKSFGNVVAINDSPKEMYGKIMAIQDELIVDYYTLGTKVPLKEIAKVQTKLNSGVNPRDIKAELAYEIVSLYYSPKEARVAADGFDALFVKKEIPDDIKVVAMPGAPILVTEILAINALTSSKSEAKRLIEQGGVKVDGAVIGDIMAEICPVSGQIIQVGKRKFIKIK